MLKNKVGDILNLQLRKEFANMSTKKHSVHSELNQDGKVTNSMWLGEAPKGTASKRAADLAGSKAAEKAIKSIDKAMKK